MVMLQDATVRAIFTFLHMAPEAKEFIKTLEAIVIENSLPDTEESIEIQPKDAEMNNNAPEVSAKKAPVTSKAKTTRKPIKK